MRISAKTTVAAVVGSPIAHSLSPVIHQAWLEAAEIDGVYLALESGDFAAFARAMRGGVIRGVNVTAPFKAEALALADEASLGARRAGAANVLVFERSGEIVADNTDGAGLLTAFAEQAPGFDPAAGPVVILGAGGAARGAAAAFVDAGTPAVRIINRSPERASELAATVGCEIVGPGAERAALADANAIVNATPSTPVIPLEAAPAAAVVMDMAYRPIVTPFLAEARRRGLRTVDGLAMLIGQARPSFQALFGVEAPPIDVRALVIAALDANP